MIGETCDHMITQRSCDLATPVVTKKGNNSTWRNRQCTDDHKLRCSSRRCSIVLSSNFTKYSKNLSHDSRTMDDAKVNPTKSIKGGLIFGTCIQS